MRCTASTAEHINIHVMGICLHGSDQPCPCHTRSYIKKVSGPVVVAEHMAGA